MTMDIRTCSGASVATNRRMSRVFGTFSFVENRWPGFSAELGRQLETAAPGNEANRMTARLSQVVPPIPPSVRVPG